MLGCGWGALGSIQQVIDHPSLGSRWIAVRCRPAAHIHSNTPPPSLSSHLGWSPLLFQQHLLSGLSRKAPLRAAAEPTQLQVTGHFIPFIVCLINLLPPALALDRGAAEAMHPRFYTWCAAMEKRNERCDAEQSKSS